jgi:DDE superfamily endonuclease
MLPLVEIPELVRHYAPYFAAVFSPDAFAQFQRYVSGLIVSENKTVEGINRLFVLDVRNQSSLNRWLTESPFSVDAINQARLALLTSLAGTQLKPQGVLSVDDTLLTHYGQHFDKIASLYDSTQGCYVWAHNLVNLHYSDDQTDYPVAFQVWEPAEVEGLEAGLLKAGIPLRPSKYVLKEQAPHKWRNYLLGLWRRHQHRPEVQQIYHSKLLIAQQLLTQFGAAHPERKLPVTFDNWYTQPAFCRFLHRTLQVPYVGTLAEDDQVLLASGATRLEAFAGRAPAGPRPGPTSNLSQNHHSLQRRKGDLLQLLPHPSHPALWEATVSHQPSPSRPLRYRPVLHLQPTALASPRYHAYPPPSLAR